MKTKHWIWAGIFVTGCITGYYVCKRRMMNEPLPVIQVFSNSTGG